jgi:hypothetical protein
LKTRILNRPAWDDAVLAIKKKFHCHNVAAKSPVSAVGVLKAFAVDPVRNEAGLVVDENAVDACFVPASNSAI